MLRINKNITINGTSEINGQQVVYMSATIATDGKNNASINQTITNQELYSKNRAVVRADMEAFANEVYRVEDEVVTIQEEVTDGGNE